MDSTPTVYLIAPVFLCQGDDAAALDVPLKDVLSLFIIPVSLGVIPVVCGVKPVTERTEDYYLLRSSIRSFSKVSLRTLRLCGESRKP